MTKSMHDAMCFGVEAAMAKMFGTEATWDVAYEAMQVVGGRGYETALSLKARGERPVKRGSRCRTARRPWRIWPG